MHGRWLHLESAAYTQYKMYIKHADVSRARRTIKSASIGCRFHARLNIATSLSAFHRRIIKYFLLLFSFGIVMKKSVDCFYEFSPEIAIQLKALTLCFNTKKDAKAIEINYCEHVFESQKKGFDYRQHFQWRSFPLIAI